MKWKIERTARGTYKLISHSGQSSNSALTSSGVPFLSGYALTQTTHTNIDDYSDEWELDPYSVVFYGITNEDHNHISCLNTIASTMLNGAWNDVTVRGGAIASSTCRDDLLSCNVFTSRSHGEAVFNPNTNILEATGIVLDDEEYDYVGFYSHLCSSMSSGSTNIQANDDYTGLKVALFIGCETAKGGE